MEENRLNYLEEGIPELAETAVKQAYWRALATGYSVLKAENGMLVEVQPDGTKKIIKKLIPHTPVEKGVDFKLR